MVLQNDILKVIEKSGARIGVALKHLESGEEVLIDADGYFPMASVVKIPILVEAAYRILDNEFTLDDRWPLINEDKNLPSGVLVFFDEGLMPTVRDILTMMIIISDNTATDMMVKRLGKDKIVKRMRDFGLEHIHITMNIRELFECLLPNAEPSLDNMEALATEELRNPPDHNSKIYQLNPMNNVSTPRDMNRLLELIYAGQTPNPQGRNIILNILFQQQFNQRIPRFLPPNVKVAHKTGTLSGVINDAGIIYINEKSHVALSTFALWDDLAVWGDSKATIDQSFAVENAIGEIGLLAYQAFL